MSDLGGVWRTVGGRRIFIKDGEDLETAMKNSGKFNKKRTKEEMAEESVLLRKQKEEIEKKLYKEKNLSQEEYEKLKNKLKEISKQKKELDKNLTSEDLKEARHRIENKEIEKAEKIITNKISDEDFKKINNELEKELINIEDKEDDYGINQSYLDEIQTKTTKKIQEMYDNNEISDLEYENYIDKYNEKISNIMYEKGYEFYEHHGKIYYSMMPKAKKAYDEILNELDKRDVKYEISRSWNPGELPSIYVYSERGDQFRIASHYNSKNQRFEAFSDEKKIYSTKDYINYKETVLKDLDNFINETK